jgi:protein-tyrosine phosphatase
MATLIWPSPMRPLPKTSLWLGHRGDVRDLGAIVDAGILAVIDLADNEPALPITRELAYCRFPLIDGAGNPAWLLQAAVGMVEQLLRTNTQALIVCSAGVSRSPMIAAAGLARWRGCPLEEALAVVQQTGPMDLSPGLLGEVRKLVVDHPH